PGRMGSDSREVTLAEGQTIENVVLTFPAGLRITGRVVDSTGRGMEGAFIRASNDREGLESTSEVNGVFVLEGFAPGELFLSAHKSGFLAARTWVTLPGPEVVLRIEPLARVSGRLAVRGRQVLQGGGVEYWVARDSWRRNVSFASADNLGRFDFAVPAGRCAMVARKEGLGQAALRLDLAPGERREVVIQLEPGGTVKGIVVLGETGEPVSGCELRLEPDAPGNSGNTAICLRSDPNGKFTEADVPAGTYTLVAEDLICAAARIEGIVVLPDQTTVVRVEVDRGQGIRGHVTKDGEPVDGARITVRKLDGRMEHTVTTSASGGFEAAGLSAGEYEVLCVAEGIKAPRRRKATVEEGGPFCGIDFPLGVALLRGRVTADGKPVPGAAVYVELVTVRDYNAECQTDESSEYAIDLPASGEYRFEVRKDEELQAGFITLPPGTTELRHGFELGTR
ncbi:MAG TPA: carboxypeptidase-like regulatory domain-containing protein, partial [Planctomycetota bacterium]|nr:carboxypeptidase-like regulatory domain-containing protein [Planctomycetota bacterium]